MVKIISKNFFIFLFFLLFFIFENIYSQSIPSNLELTSSIATLSNWFFYLLLFVSTFCFVLGGWQFLQAKGDPNEIKKAQTMIVYAVFAILTAILSIATVKFFTSIFL